MLRYIGEALSERASFAACSAAAVAATGSSGGTAAFSTADLRGLLRQLAEEVARDRFALKNEKGKALGGGGGVDEAAQFGIARRVEELEERLEEAQAQATEVVRSQIEEQLHEAWGGVRLCKAISGPGRRAAVTHSVELGDVRFPVASWKTYCGWTFGAAATTRVPRSEADCPVCRGVEAKRAGGIAAR